MRSGFITLVIVYCLSCNSKQESKISEDFKIILTIDSPSYFYGPVIHAGNELGLKPIKKGVDSFELRLWSGRTTLPERLFSIKYENGNWIATWADLWLKRDTINKYTSETWYETTKYISDSSKSYVFPRKDYSKFIDSVILLGLQELPIQTKESYLDHPTFYTIEMATNSFYKFVSYDTPHLNLLFPQTDEKTDPNNQIFTNLLLLIDRHFYQREGYKTWYKKTFEYEL